jgi:hypothetical protein
MFRFVALPLVALAVSDETSLMQGLKPVADVKSRHDKNAVTNLLESAKGMLKNGETADVVAFATATLEEITSQVIPAIQDAHNVEQALLTSHFQFFADAVSALEIGVSEVVVLHQEQDNQNTLHLQCRDLEAAKCDVKRDCDCQLYRHWLSFVEEESALRHIEHQIENRIDGHFCKEDGSGASPSNPSGVSPYIANGTTHVFRQTSVPIFEAFQIQWPRVVIEENQYEVLRPQCETHYSNLDAKTASCDSRQTSLEEAACHHGITVAEVRSQFDCAWSQAMYTYDLTEKESRLMMIDRIREFRTLSTVQCLLDRTTERNGRPCDEATDEATTEITHCEQARRDVVITWLELDFPCEVRECGAASAGIGPHLAEDESVLAGCSGPLVCPAIPPVCGYNADGIIVGGACRPEPPVHPCTAGLIFAGLPAVPEHPMFAADPAGELGVTVSDPGTCNPHCNERPLCQACNIPAPPVCPVPDWVWAQYTSMSLRHTDTAAISQIDGHTDTYIARGQSAGGNLD